MNKKIYILIFISLALIGIKPVEAAKFFMAPPVLTISQETETILNIDTEKENINAMELKLSFSPEDFLIKNINEGGSLISFWVEPPSFSNEKGEIFLTGIIPGGYQGNSGELLKINLIPLQTGEKKFTLSQAKILLNDGQGTAAKLNSSILNFQVMPINPLIETKKPEIKDAEPPESFTPEIGQSPDIFNNQWFLVFNTQDKNSGLAFYQIRETKQKILVPFIKWETANSPYILKDQQLKSFIYVKAVDREGNVRIAIVSPVNPLKWYEDYWIWIIIILIIIGFFLWRKK
jgi:hypothetical protein